MFHTLVDIQDVVKAHIQAAKILEAAGKRYIVVQSDGRGELLLHARIVCDSKDGVWPNGLSNKYPSCTKVGGMASFVGKCSQI